MSGAGRAQNRPDLELSQENKNMVEPHTETSGTDVAATGPSYDDVNTPVIFMVAFISAALTFLVIALVQGMSYQWEKAYLKKMEVVSVPAAEEVAAQKKVLEGGDGIVPIKDAMAKVIEQYGDKN